MAHTMDSPKLRQLSRTQLQSLAKLEVVRAVGKTEDIIRRLIKKHPKGVPIVGDGELCVTREYVEVFLMGKMKEKKELWDGTGNMKKGPRKFRMEWLRSERKAESVKRWQEANKMNAAHNVSLAPYELFASESDEEVIESLQTTPANSRCGSPKRAREETDETDDDRRKRSRP